MTYTLISGSSAVTRDIDKATIPNDPNNRDWIAYQAWLAQGNTPNPAPAPLSFPLTIASWQGVALMRSTAFDPSQSPPDYQAIVAGQTNLYGAVKALVNASNNQALIAYFEFSPTFFYGDALLSLLASELGLSDNQVLTMFNQAAALSI